MGKTFLILLIVSGFLDGMQHSSIPEYVRTLIAEQTSVKDFEHARMCTCGDKLVVALKDMLFTTDVSQERVRKIQGYSAGIICALELVNNMFGDEKNWLAVGCDNGEIYVLNLEEGLYKKFNKLKGAITRIAADPSGNYLAVEYQENKTPYFALSRSYLVSKIGGSRKQRWENVWDKQWTEFAVRPSRSSLETIIFEENSCTVTYPEEQVTWVLP